MTAYSNAGFQSEDSFQSRDVAKRVTNGHKHVVLPDTGRTRIGQTLFNPGA